jgi:hypothetical protein
MILGVMQPYFFPYIGYFQLMKAVDKFIIYDDVNYIKNGWIDRNKILVNKKPIYFKLPIEKASSFKKINETKINYQLYDPWKKKFYKTLELAYKKAPLYNETMSVIENVIEKKYLHLGMLSGESIIEVAKYLGLDVEIIISSSKYNNKDLERTERLIDFCKKENCNTYTNNESGKLLYKKEDFRKKKIELRFLKTNICEYNQLNPDFVPGLSIIDVMMFNEIEMIKSNLLNNYLL